MKANEVSKVIKNTIIKKTWTNFQNKYLPKRFEKDYAVNVLGFRKRIRSPKGANVILIKSGNLRRMVMSSIKVADNVLSFELPTYASARSWKVDQADLIDFILQRVEKITFRAIKEVLRDITRLPEKSLNKMTRKIYNRIKSGVRPEKKKIWFNVGKSIKQELQTVKEDEIVNSYNQIKEV